MYCPIHPHIQWGNRFCLKNAAPHRDTPSHTVREPAGGVLHLPPFRYTLTYSEGTCPSQFGKFDSPIHPHIQWGNYFPLSIFNNPCDTPSHTVREPKEMFSRDKMTRYTLTYSEGTAQLFYFPTLIPIHPHIQWGNGIIALDDRAFCDTPSHTVREHPAQPLHECNHRYTLTYSEGTSTAIFIMPSLTIHPHIQWGNDISFKQLNHINDTPSHTVREPQYLRGFQPLQIHRCAICTKAFCHPRHIFNMPKNLIC